MSQRSIRISYQNKTLNIMSDMPASRWMQTLGSREFPQHALQAIHENALWDPMSKTLATARCDCDT